MRIPFHFLMLGLLWSSGCASSHHISTTLLEAGLNLQIKSITAGGVWSTGEGHGLEVNVWAERDVSDYERSLTLEIDGAAKVCAAFANSDAVRKWNYLDLRFFNKYRPAPRSSPNLAGVARVIIRQETLQMLRERNVPTSEYPRYWKFLHGYKDQPDSKELLTW